MINKGILFVKDYPATGIPNPYQFNQKCGANLTLTDSTVIYYVQSLAECRIQIPLRSFHFLVEIMTAFNIESKLNRFYTTIYWKDDRRESRIRASLYCSIRAYPSFSMQNSQFVQPSLKKYYLVWQCKYSWLPFCRR